MQQAKVCIPIESNKAIDVQATVWMNFWISGESGAWPDAIETFNEQD